MRRITMKSIWIAVTTAIIILLAAPTIAVASMAMTADSCDASPLHGKAPIPICCLMSDCLLSNCSLSNAADNKVMLPSRFVLNKNVYIAVSKTSVSAETFLNPKKPLQQGPTQELLSNPCTQYYCRNSLNSEDPLQV